MNTLIVAPLLIPLATLVATLLARRAPPAVENHLARLSMMLT